MTIDKIRATCVPDVPTTHIAKRQVLTANAVEAKIEQCVVGWKYHTNWVNKSVHWNSWRNCHNSCHVGGKNRWPTSNERRTSTKIRPTRGSCNTMVVMKWNNRPATPMMWLNPKMTVMLRKKSNSVATINKFNALTKKTVHNPPMIKRSNWHHLKCNVLSVQCRASLNKRRSKQKCWCVLTWQLCHVHTDRSRNRLESDRRWLGHALTHVWGPPRKCVATSQKQSSCCVDVCWLVSKRNATLLGRRIFE